MIGDSAENSSEQAPAPLCEWLCRTSAVVAAFAGPLAVGAVTTGVAIATSHETISETVLGVRQRHDGVDRHARYEGAGDAPAHR